MRPRSSRLGPVHRSLAPPGASRPLPPARRSQRRPCRHSRDSGTAWASGTVERRENSRVTSAQPNLPSVNRVRAGVLRAGAFACLAAVALWAGLGLGPEVGRHTLPVARATTGARIHKIKHVVIIMQENRSFDSFFGTFPGADGSPMKNGIPTVCVPDPYGHRCVRPFHTAADREAGGPHDHVDAINDIDGGKMDGFI